MLTFLARCFIPDRENTASPAVRKAYGVLCGAVGIALNLLLFAGKFLAGRLSGSIAITADAFNNLSDAGSSVVTLLGFHLAGQKPDIHHPFGHGRMEYISGLAVSALILLMGVELGKESLGKILHPEDVTGGPLVLVILAVSIAVKLYMMAYNRTIGKKLNAPALLAAAADSLSDSVATTAVLLATILGQIFGWRVDGWAGLAVAGFILYAGIGAARDTISPLLGNPPTPEFVEEIRSLVMAHPEVLGIHDLVVHDYGPGRLFASLHAEVDKNGDISAIHDVIDRVERQILHELGCEVCIHMDPIAVGDRKTAECRTMVAQLLAGLDPRLTMHDFRITSGPDHTNLIFDVVRPLDSSYTSEELEERIRQAVTALEGNYYAVITVDTPRV